MPLDRCFVEHCSPTLANLKTASLFSCSYTSEQDLLQLTHGWSTAFQPKGGSCSSPAHESRESLDLCIPS